MTVIGFVRESKSETKDGKDGSPYDQRTVNIEGLRCSVPGKAALPLENSKIEGDVVVGWAQAREGEDFGHPVYKLNGWRAV